MIKTYYFPIKEITHQNKPVMVVASIDEDLYENLSLLDARFEEDKEKEEFVKQIESEDIKIYSIDLYAFDSENFELERIDSIGGYEIACGSDREELKQLYEAVIFLIN